MGLVFMSISWSQFPRAHLCYQWGLPLLPAPTLFHAYLIEACGKEVANENGLSLSQELCYTKLSCFLRSALHLLKFYLILTCFYDNHFSPAPWQK